MLDFVKGYNITHVLVSKYLFPLKRTMSPWRNGWIRGWDRESTICPWNIIVEHKNKEVLKNDEELLERSQTAELPLTKSGII